MKKTLKLLRNDFESSSGLTPEFAEFFKTFKSEFTKELNTIGATDITFSRGHFYVSGFFTVDGQIWYFNIGDVRGMVHAMDNGSCMGKLLYRTALSNKDYTGGTNRYATIRVGMAEDMCWSFKLIN